MNERWNILWAALLLLVPAAALANQTPGDASAVRIEPEANELGEMGSIFDDYVALYPQYNFYRYVNVGLDGYPDVTMLDYVDFIEGGLGWYQIGAHSSATGVELEVFAMANSTEWNNSWNTYTSLWPSNEIFRYVHTDQNGNPLYRVIGATRLFISHHFHSNQSIVHHNGCFAWGLRTGYVNALAYASYDDTLYNTVMRDVTTQFYRHLSGPTLRVFATAANGINPHFLTLDNQHAVAAPIVLNTSLDNVTTITASTPVTVNFDCPMNTSVAPTDVVKGTGTIKVSGAAWNGATQITCTVSGTAAGPGSFIVDSYDPVHFDLTGAMSQPGHIGLDGNTDPFSGPSGIPPNGDNYILNLTSAMTGDDPASQIAGFAAVRQGSGVVVGWGSSLEHGADQFLVEWAPDWSTPFVEVGRTAATGAARYEVPVPDHSNGIFRLREIETAGDTLVHAWDEACDPFTIVTDASPPAPTDSLMNALAQAYPVIPESVPEHWDYLIFTPRAFEAQADLFVNFWAARGLSPLRVTLEDIGGASHIKSTILAYRNTLKYVLLFGDANDDADVSGQRFWPNDALWANWLAPRPAWPAEPGLNYIPMSYYQPDPGTVTTGMAYFTPYTGSDWGYVDFDGDSLPDPGLAIGRAPVSSTAEALAFYQKTVNAVNLSTSTTYMNHAGMWTLGRDVEGRSGALVEQLSQQLATDLPASLTLDRIDDAPPAPPMTQAQRNTAAKNALDQGRSVVMVMSTVGDSYHWGGYLNLANGFVPSSLVSNPTRLPFLLGADCDIGDVDRTEDPSHGTPLVERFTADPNRGPWGFFGPSRGTWIDGDYRIAHEFLQRVYHVGAASAGQAAALAVSNAARAHPEYKTLARSFVFIGDPAVRIPFMVTPVDCNNNGVPDYKDIADGTSLDVDCNMIPDDCEPQRVALERSQITTCPAGDLDSIRVTVNIAGMCGVNLDNPNPPVMAVRRTPRDPVWVWKCVTATDPFGDTLKATHYDAATHTAVLNAAAISGCGTLVYDVYAGGQLVKRGVTVNVRSLDEDPQALGSVDHFDSDLWATQFFNNIQGCGDFNWSGSLTTADISLLGAHFGQHVPRHVLAPDGGEVYGWGGTIPITWERGRGTGSLVTLYLERDSQPGTRWVLKTDAPDDGADSWSAYPDAGPGNDFHVVVMHTAGPDAGNNSIGEDRSDGPFTISAPSGGGGCPFAETRTTDGWKGENTILGRSRFGGLASDALLLKNAPLVVDGRYELRIRENEQEYTTLDQVGLMTIDHPPGWTVFWEAGKPILGRPLPAVRVTTRKGEDITDKVDGSGRGTFVGLPGETLDVKLWPDRLNGQAFEKPSPIFLIPRRKEVEEAQPRTPVSDEAIIDGTGVLIQILDPTRGWTTLDRVYPREDFATMPLAGMGSAAPIRLVFVGRHEIRFIGTVERASFSPTTAVAVPSYARHSRAGAIQSLVRDADDLTALIAPGDTLSVDFVAPPAPEGQERHWALLTRGVYSSQSPQGTVVPKPTPRFALEQNHPNPFDVSTTIRFEIPSTLHVRLELFDLQGRRVKSLVDETLTPGPHAATWDQRDESGHAVHPGVYVYRIQAGPFRATRKAVVLP